VLTVANAERTIPLIRVPKISTIIKWKKQKNIITNPKYYLSLSATSNATDDHPASVRTCTKYSWVLKNSLKFEKLAYIFWLDASCFYAS